MDALVSALAALDERLVVDAAVELELLVCAVMD
jgi:hypothetical protein